MKKLLPVIVGLTVFSLVSCDKGTVNLVSEDKTIAVKEENNETANYFKGTHRLTAPTVEGKYIIKDGLSPYAIVIKENASLVEKSAAQEFNFFLKEATGIELNVITDAGINHSPSDYYISLGETNLLKTSALSYDLTTLKNDGIMIKSKDNNIYLCGGGESGTIFSVYDFMKIVFNYEQYGVDTYEIDKNVDTVLFRNFDVIDIPDIPLRSNNFGMFNVGSGTYNQSMYGYRMRMYEDRGYYMMPVYKEYDITSPSKDSTNTNTYIPYEKFHSTNPKWFSDNCRENSQEYQLCYTAHGDEVEYNALINEVTHKIIFSLQTFKPIDYPDMKVITFTMEDNFCTCTCDTCTEAKHKYGSDAGALNIFVNKVGENIENWMNKPENAEFKRDDFHIIFFAYNAFEEPPAHYDEASKKYVPNDPSVRLRSNVGAYFAEINNMDYQQDFFCEKNANGKRMFDAWCDISDFVYYWTYATNFHYYMYFYDSFSCFNQKMYNYIASKNVDMFFAQGQDSCGRNGTNWNGYKAWLDAKLGWDTSLDQTELMNKYFSAMYKEAAQDMKDLFYLTRAQNMQVFARNPNLLCLRSNYNEVNKKAYYPLNELKSLVKGVDDALLKIEKYKLINPDLYTILYRNIEAEAVTPLYTMLDLRITELSRKDKQDIISRLYDDITLLSLESKKTKEHGIALSEELAKFEAQ